MRYEVSRTRGALITIFFATLLSLTLLLAAPLEAQETTDKAETTAQTSDVTATVTEDGETTAQAGDTTVTTAKANGDAEQSVQQGAQQTRATEDDSSQAATRATTTLDRRPARVTESAADPDEIVDRIVVPVANCEVDPDATLVVEDDDGTSVSLTNGQNVTVTANDNGLTIVGAGVNGNLIDLDQKGGDQQFGTVRETVQGEVVSSTGITCSRTDDDDGNNGKAQNANSLEDLGCDELLRRFRSADDRQYNNGALFTNVNVRNQIIVCLEEEVVGNTAADEQLPDTGGPSLLGLAALGVVSAVFGASVIRGARR